MCQNALHYTLVTILKNDSTKNSNIILSSAVCLLLLSYLFYRLWKARSTFTNTMSIGPPAGSCIVIIPHKMQGFSTRVWGNSLRGDGKFLIFSQKIMNVKQQYKWRSLGVFKVRIYKGKILLLAVDASVCGNMTVKLYIPEVKT